MFSTNHFIWLALCAVLVIAGSIAAVKGKLPFEKTLTIVCALCVLSEIVKIFCVLISEERSTDYGVFIKETDLPFHLCSLQLFFAFFAKLTKSQAKRDFMVTFMIPTCILGGFAALMIPTISCSFTNPRTYQYFLYHAGLIWFGVTAICQSGVKLDFKAFLKTMVTLLTIVWITFYINGITQKTNFLYLSKPPMDGLPILNMDNGWFVYFLSYMGVALTLILLFFLPFWITYAVKAKRNTSPN